jgi:3-oxoacyl-[acyl-carrier-protein] synthase-3
MKEEKRIGIAGTGYYVPEKVLTNADLEKMVDTSNQWIVERTGIRERRIAAPEETVSSMAENASRQALAAAGVEPGELDLIIMGTFTADNPLPAAACLLGARLGNQRAASFDLSAACSAFIYGLEVGEKLLSGGEYRTGLIVVSEKLSIVTNWEDRDTCVLFGDGAGAAVIRPGGKGGHVIVDSYLGADGSKAYLLEIPAGGSARPVTHEVLDQKLNCIRMEGRETFKLAVSSMVSAARLVLERNGLGSEDVAWLLPHQANLRIMKAVARGLKIPVEQVYINVDRYGNMSGATIPIGLAEMDHNGVLKKGDLVLLVAFGGGLTWAASLIRW